MKSKLTGTGVALVTPFNANGSVDFSSLEKLVQHVSLGGVDFLVALGTTAETPTLTDDEQASILACIKACNAGKLPLVVGIAGNNTAAVVDKIRRTKLDDVAMILSSTPHYNKPSQQGLYEHFKAIAAASPAPIMLYNVPSRTGVNMSADTTLRLAHELENVASIKEASGSVAQLSHILRGKPKDFTVLSGDDGFTLPLMAVGAEGVVSVAANAIPKPVADMVHLAAAQRYNDAATLHLSLQPILDAMFAEGNPTGVKAALALAGLCHNTLRLPLTPASAELQEKIKGLMSELGAVMLPSAGKR